MAKNKLEYLFEEKSRMERIIIMALIPVPFLATIYLLTQVKRIENEIRRECSKGDDVIIMVSEKSNTETK